ncbi:hypothetical protein RN51_01694 [Microbacterium oxydans]|uniref:Uncharacterized protein n=1 Tax=Microbacterium oxydans TaxID=82380 RepID=A0A0F0KPZ4_9MICO|nr:hypothetical protein [Microbacterium oxydans]KJL22948.1 hypothetical protein RN51_01694 [Microbacterium oxydans]
MRDINTGGNLYGGIHVHDQQQQYVPYEQCSDEQLDVESARLRGSRSHLQKRRLIKLGVFGTPGIGVGFFGLWLLNGVDTSLPGIVGVVIAGLTLYFSYDAWARPNDQEAGYTSSLRHIHQIQQHREDPRKKRKNR